MINNNLNKTSKSFEVALPTVEAAVQRDHHEPFLPKRTLKKNKNQSSTEPGTNHPILSCALQKIQAN